MPGRYRSFSGTIIDPEKPRLSLDSNSDTSSYSSRSSASTNSYPYNDHPHYHRHDSYYHDHPRHHTRQTSSITIPIPRFLLRRRRCNPTTYLTLTLLAILGAFVFYLVHASWQTHALLVSGKLRPAAPLPVWERFEFLTRYYGGLRSVGSRAWREWPTEEGGEGEVVVGDVEKIGTVGVDGGSERDGRVKCWLDEERAIEVPSLLAYEGVPAGFPDAAMGSHEVLGLRDDVCFERYGRFGLYGYGYSRRSGGTGAGLEGDMDGADAVWQNNDKIDYNEISWNKAQDRCFTANKHRFRTVASDDQRHTYTTMKTTRSDRSKEAHDAQADVAPSALNRTAVIIRTWSDYKYDAEDILNLRALISELSLQSGGEYTVHFLVHVKNDTRQIWSEEATYQQMLEESLPQEFQGLGTLWSERQMNLIYGGVEETFWRDLPVHGVYRSANMPLQYFAHMHPEYDFFWNWEMDVRYTGHFLELFHKTTQWAKEQPRKGLWERNGRFYIPAEHGSWEDFRQMVRVQTAPERPVWGALRPKFDDGEMLDTTNDPIPPTTYDKDNYVWGVGEEADLITFNPIFDPVGSNWIISDDMTGYNHNTTTNDPSHPDYIPRRAAIITASRLSARLLNTMHAETSLARHTMSSEMWPATVALHHGLKAVYAPHPVYVDRAWPSAYLDAVFNAGAPGSTAAANAGMALAAARGAKNRVSVFGDGRQHNFLGTTWYYHASFAPNLWRRWWGYRVNGTGGMEEEMAGEGRMCLPGMLLHPVKEMELVVE